MAVQVGDAIRQRIQLQQWLRIDPRNKPKIYAQIYAAADVSSFNYWLEIFFFGGHRRLWVGLK